MKRTKIIGVGGVLATIGLFSKNDCYDIDEDVLIAKLCARYDVKPEEAKKIIEDTIDFGAIARVDMEEGHIIIRLVLHRSNVPLEYLEYSVQIRRDVWLRELSGRLGITERQAKRIVKSAVDAGVLAETEADGEKLLRYKK